MARPPSIRLHLGLARRSSDSSSFRHPEGPSFSGPEFPIVGIGMASRLLVLRGGDIEAETNLNISKLVISLTDLAFGGLIGFSIFALIWVGKIFNARIVLIHGVY